MEETGSSESSSAEIADRKKTNPKAVRRKYVPQLDSTDAESYYCIKQISAGTPLVVRLTDGEEIQGDLSWYDKDCISICSPDGRRFMIRKHVIRTIHKQ